MDVELSFFTIYQLPHTFQGIFLVRITGRPPCSQVCASQLRVHCSNYRGRLARGQYFVNFPAASAKRIFMTGAEYRTVPSSAAPRSRNNHCDGKVIVRSLSEDRIRHITETSSFSISSHTQSRGTRRLAVQSSNPHTESEKQIDEVHTAYPVLCCRCLGRDGASPSHDTAIRSCRCCHHGKPRANPSCR